MNMAKALEEPTQTVSFLLSQEIATKQILRYFIKFCDSSIEELFGSGEVPVIETSHGRWLAKVPDRDMSDGTPSRAVELEYTGEFYELRFYGERLPNKISMFEFLRYCSSEYAKSKRG
jgi:hypothetical protein